MLTLILNFFTILNFSLLLLFGQNQMSNMEQNMPKHTVSLGAGISLENDNPAVFSGPPCTEKRK